MTAIIYMVLTTAMFYSQDTYLQIGAVAYSYKNIFALLILFLVVVNFIFTARLDRLIVLFRHSIVQMLPFLIPFFFTAILWVAEMRSLENILSGCGIVIHQLLAVLLAAAALYLFGEKGVWYFLGAMCAGNLMLVLQVIWEGGIAEFFGEFFALVRSFSMERGPMTGTLEINDLTYAIGVFLLYLLLYKRECGTTARWLLWLAVSLFFFLVGLKRIAVLAVVLSMLVVFFLRLLPEKAARQTAYILALGMMSVSFLYIFGIRNGLFPFLEEHFGLDTMGRVEIYDQIAPYYDISITFMGQGLDFETYSQSGSYALHNDFLRMYLHIGFVGYWIWLCGYLLVRLRYWFHQGGKDGGCLFLAICIYSFALYATDNTISYLYVLSACALLPMAWRFDELTATALDKAGAAWRREDDEVLISMDEGETLRR